MNSPRPLFATIHSTPVGPLAVAAEADGVVAATAFGDLMALAARLEPGAEFTTGAAADRVLATARTQLREYFAGKRREFEVGLAARGSEFQQRVWAALRAIPPGETRSYGELARTLGSAARAVGRANATNPIAVIVPCHRVIGADGKLTGFAFGTAIKAWLLAHERR
jgi:methylated-DNA-[protein]-cysteine S-methyltransferase